MPSAASLANYHSCSWHTLCSIPHSKQHDIQNLSIIHIDGDFYYTHMCILCNFVLVLNKHAWF